MTDGQLTHCFLVVQSGGAGGVGRRGVGPAEGAAGGEGRRGVLISSRLLI